MTMDPDVRRRWVAALRSGDYDQAAGKLTHLDADGAPRYCCLGVLCALAVEAGVVASRDTLGYWRGYGVERAGGESFSLNYLPVEVVLWADLPSADPVVRTGGVPERLSTLNDAGTPFDRVARLIEECL